MKIPNKLFYVFLVLASATAVPLMAHAEDGDGPSITVVHHDSDTVTADPKKPEVKPEVKKEEAKVSLPAPTPDRYGTVGGQIGGSSQQGFAVGATLGYTGDHEGVSATATLGAGGPSVFAAGVSAQGLRTNGSSTGGVTVAGVLNGSAGIGTSGDGTANGVAAAAILIPFSGSGIGCLLGVGPAAGGMYSTEAAGKDANGANQTTSAAGPGGYLGIGCEGSFWKVDLYNHAIVNSLHTGDPSNPTVAVLQSRVQAMFRVNSDMAVGGWAQMDGDIRDSKFAPAVAGGVLMTYTFGGGSSPSSPAAKAREKDKDDNSVEQYRKYHSQTAAQ